MKSRVFFSVTLISLILTSMIGCSKDEPTKPTAPSNVVGTWSISWSTGVYYGVFEIKFKSDFTYSKDDGETTGTYSSDGKDISWKQGNAYYSGTINGKEMSGTLSHGTFFGTKL